VISSYQPFPYAVDVSDSSDIRFRNVHVYSNSKVPFDNSIFDQTYRFEVRPLEFAWLDIRGKPPEQRRQARAPVVAPGAKLTKLVTGFFSISGAAVDPSGDLYFVDAHWQRIYRWSPETREAVIVRSSPLEPVNLAFDRAGDLMVTSYAGKGTVYWFRPGTPEHEVHFLRSEPSIARPGMTAFLAADYWMFNADMTAPVTDKKPYQYISPDHTTFIPASENFVSGELAWGTKTGDVITSYGLEKAVPGRTIYVIDSYQGRTYRAVVDADGTLSNLMLFAEQGGTSLAQDKDGNVYVAAGQVLVFNQSGKQIGTIEVPERPIDLVFGGSDRRTLFILSHHSLFSIDIRTSG
jgi:sugar lactone lactonase YvrE